MNIVTNGQKFNFNREHGSCMITGNGNNIFMKFCSGSFMLTGNGNVVSTYGSKLQIKIVGNGNQINTNGSLIWIDITGNGNNFTIHRTKLLHMVVNGHGNNYPQKNDSAQSMQPFFQELKKENEEIPNFLNDENQAQVLDSKMTPSKNP